jgi:hypothetical protein
MSAYDRLVKEFNSRKFKSDEIRSLIEKFKVEMPFYQTKKELAKTLSSLLLKKDDLETPRVKSPRKKSPRKTSPRKKTGRKSMIRDPYTSGLGGHMYYCDMP